MRKCKHGKKCPLYYKQNFPITLQRKVNVKKDVFSSCHDRGIKENSESPWGIEPQTFGIALRCSTTEPQDSSVSEIYYEVLITRVLHTVRISNVDSVMFLIEIVEMVSFELGEDSSWGLRNFLYLTLVTRRKNIFLNSSSSSKLKWTMQTGTMLFSSWTSAVTSIFHCIIFVHKFCPLTWRN